MNRGIVKPAGYVIFHEIFYLRHDGFPKPLAVRYVSDSQMAEFQAVGDIYLGDGDLEFSTDLILDGPNYLPFVLYGRDIRKLEYHLKHRDDHISSFLTVL